MLRRYKQLLSRFASDVGWAEKIHGREPVSAVQLFLIYWSVQLFWVWEEDVVASDLLPSVRVISTSL